MENISEVDYCGFTLEKSKDGKFGDGFEIVKYITEEDKSKTRRLYKVGTKSECIVWVDNYRKEKEEYENNPEEFMKRVAEKEEEEKLKAIENHKQEIDENINKLIYDDLFFHNTNVRKMMNVTRFSSMLKNRKNDLTQHSFFVLKYFINFAKFLNISYTADTLETILNHDYMESITGDLDYAVKNMSKNTKKWWSYIEKEVVVKNSMMAKYTDEWIELSLNNEQLKLFKCCDLLDCWFFCIEEYLLGNKTNKVSQVISDCEEIIFKEFEIFKRFMNDYKLSEGIGL